MSDLSSTLGSVHPVEPLATTDHAAHKLPYGASRLDALANSIRESHRGLTTAVFAIGRDLKEAKHLLTHGQFGAWLTKEFAWSPSTANRYMQAHTVWGEKEALVGDLEATGIYLLTAKRTPEGVRDEIESELERGERPSLREIRERVKTARQDASGEGAAPDRETKARDAAAFILERAIDELPTLHALLRGIDPAALVKALRLPRVDPRQPEQARLGLP